VERGFFPLDQRLRLRRGPWSEGVVQEAARLGACEPSFGRAAETYQRLTGGEMSATTLWRLTQEAGEQVQAVQQAEEAVACQVDEMGQVPLHDPVDERVSISLDGTTVLTRESGWREVKGVAVSAVEEIPETGEVHLTRHSYRARLCDKEAFEAVQWAEACRRGVSEVQDITSVNDGAPWIWDVVWTCYPEATEVLDWPHAVGHLWKAGQAAYGEGTEEAERWVTGREGELWEGDVVAVQRALRGVSVEGEEQAQAIRQVKAYVATHRHRMDYARCRRERRPIGSGAIESGCKNVVGWRMKRGGARWCAETVSRMTALLGEIHSGRWDEAWERAQTLA
jgi:hypothetical protein